MSLHMTGSKTDEAGNDHIDASELLGDDGKIDVSKVNARAKNGNYYAQDVTAAEADDIRNKLLAGWTVQEVANAVGYSEHTVMAHARGERQYKGGEPELAPVEYRAEKWRYQIDD